MAAPYAPSAPVVPHWQNQGELRSVTPATSNGRQPAPQQQILPQSHYGGGGGGGGMQQQRYASAPRMGGSGAPVDPNAVYSTHRSMTPNRMGVYNRPDDTSPAGVVPQNLASPTASAATNGPSSTGLIRLSLKKPMGIVFEPMYDPNQPSAQRGVRICDLPRTGAASLSRKLQVGDELLQINDKTVSRLTFDEIMDFIIDADPDSVNLLFRRPRKETLQARQGVQQKLQAAANKDAPSKIKWKMDETAQDDKKKSNKKGKKKKKGATNKKRGSVSEEEDETTLPSSLGGAEESHPGAAKKTPRTRKKGREKKGPYETESFLDLLIDTICSNSGVCRDMARKDDYISEDDDEEEEEMSFDSKDESTYVTYEESVDKHNKAKVVPSKKAQTPKKKKTIPSYPEEEEEEEEEETTEAEETEEEAEKVHSPRSASKRHDKVSSRPKNGILQVTAAAQPHPYHKETPITPVMVEPVVPHVRVPEQRSPTHLQQPQHVPYIGLSSPPATPIAVPPPIMAPPPELEEDEQTNPAAPIREVEYDDEVDHGADVSVMESLGGPSLLIEKQRAQQIQLIKPPAVPSDIIEKYGQDYPADYGKSQHDTIQANPTKFYTYVVRSLLEQNEPEKVRLLDKLLAKYKGREDHLIQKLSVRYNNREQEPAEEAAALAEAVQKSKASPMAAQNVHVAQRRMEEEQHHVPEPQEEEEDEKDQEQPVFAAQWPEKEEKEQEAQDHDDEVSEEEEGSEYSREDSVDGTSPAVIAQVSELLNYVYGKTSVPGQIDRVSTIMRAYEGREAVLLELLETKALIKANKEKNQADELPAFLRNSPQVRDAPNDEDDDVEEERHGTSPLSSNQVPVQQVLQDDISSMSGVSSPVVNDFGRHQQPEPIYNMPATMEDEDDEPNFFASTPRSARSKDRKSFPTPPPPPKDTPHKRKKGIFGNLFKKKDRSASGLKNKNGSSI